MEGHKIYITRMIPEKAILYLKGHCDVEVNPEDRPLDRSELLDKVRNRHGVITTLNDKVDAELMDVTDHWCGRVYSPRRAGVG
jgi:lactate dehydrogenase-like 2-hydroxyacid dehydrogenase